jgi:RND family efflux transporter MFP subunit
MMMIKWISMLALLPCALAGCAEPLSTGHGHEHGGQSVTLWTDKTELFMEHDDLMVGHEAAFLAHLTDLKDFSPVREGRLTMRFKNEACEILEFVADQPIRDGIFEPVAIFRQAGKYALEMLLQSPGLSDRIDVGEVVVHPHVHEHEEVAGHDDGESDLGLISFLKEQQWKIDFQTADVEEHDLIETVRAVGEVLPRLDGHARVSSPVEGMILADQSGAIPATGAVVAKEQVLVKIAPPLNTEGGWVALRRDYERARVEHERAQRLLEKSAISEKEYQEALWEYQARKSSYQSLVGGIDRVDLDPASRHFHLKAPISGVVTGVNFVPGQMVSAGDDLFEIIDPTRVWLVVRVPEKDAGRIGKATGAFYEILGSEGTHVLDDSNSQMVSVGDVVDPDTRTVGVVFEVDNPERTLRVGQFVRVALHTTSEFRDVAVPSSALYDEGGTHAVYVQREGEAFEKRLVTTGIRFRDHVHITGGLSVGERIVTVGGYQVKLASMSTEVGHGHTH